MPPRRPTNSLFRRFQQPKVEEPLQVIAVPTRASETFADVWKHIRERYERNYGQEEVAKGWFHKLQDRFGADIDSHDGVGELGYSSKSPKEDLVLVMLQNAIDRDGSVPDTSGLRPPGFSRPELTSEQQEQVKRRKIQQERYGASLDEVDEDTPIESHERSMGPGSPERNEADEGSRKVDADGFAVPALPGVSSRKRKRPQRKRDDVILSSMEGENEEDILVSGSQAPQGEEESVPNSFPENTHQTRSRDLQSVPLDAAAGASTAGAERFRASTAGPEIRRDVSPVVSRPRLQKQTLSKLQATSELASVDDQKDRAQPRSPPTPVSGKSHTFTQQPPESAQRPKPTPSGVSLAAASTQSQLNLQRENLEDDEFDPIEDDDLLQGIAGDNDFDDLSFDPPPPEEQPLSTAPSTAKKDQGKLKKIQKMLTLTPKPKGSENLPGTQGSSSKNPRSHQGPKSFWSTEEDTYILKGFRQGLSAAEIVRTFEIQHRTTSAVRSRQALLLKQNPDIKLLKGVSEAPSDYSSPGPGSGQGRKPWPLGDIQVMNRAIADGYDALEIKDTHFPKRSEDSVYRKVLALQDQAWKNAEKNPLFPQNHAQLEGWTLKDSCKLRRAFREGLPAGEAKGRFFRRWEMSEVQKQLDGYKAQIKALEADQGRSVRASRTADEPEIESSQLLANSSPVERSMQARAARRPSATTNRQSRLVEVPSSPPQVQRNPDTGLGKKRPSMKAKRSSSPRVEVSSAEQETARGSLTWPSSGTQTTLKFTRDKGKQRAGAPRPTDEELDAQYDRNRRTTTIENTTEHVPQEPPVKDSSKSDGFVRDEDQEQTPADDLDMLEAQLASKGQDVEDDGNVPPGTSTQEQRQSSLAESTPKRSSVTVRKQSDANAPSPAAQPTPLSALRRQNEGTRKLLSPMKTGEGSTPISSDQRRRSRMESGIDTRAAVQLSQELQRSLSSEDRATQESQAFQTQDPSTTRSQRAAVSVRSNDVPKIHAEQDEEISNASPSSKNQRGLRPSGQRTSASPEGSMPHSQPTSLQPSPQIGTSEPDSSHAPTPASGRLPSRGPSYASRIRDLQREPSATTPALNGSAQAPEIAPPSSADLSSARNHREPTPTDAEIWEKTANAASLGRDRQEYFEELKIKTFSVRAMSRGDWNEVARLKAAERRLHRQRKVSRGGATLPQVDVQHMDGPAQGGDTEQADEDVVRVDDESNADSVPNDDFGEQVWSDEDFEQPEEMDVDRHVSEVDDEEEAPGPNGDSPEPENAMNGLNERQANVQNGEVPDGGSDVEQEHLNEVDQDKEAFDTTAIDDEVPHTNGVDAMGEPKLDGEDEEDEPELPTVANLSNTNSDARHALTDENLQELNNSGAENSPQPSRKRKATAVESTPPSHLSKVKSDDRTAMPPPLSTKAANKRARRRHRGAVRRSSESGSERRSSFDHHLTAPDGQHQHAPSTPVQNSSSAQRKPSLSTPAPQSSKAKGKSLPQPTNAAPPTSSMGVSQMSRSIGGGLSGLVRKAHIPSPPKAKKAPPKQDETQQRRKLSIRQDDDESDDSSDSSD